MNRDGGEAMTRFGRRYIMGCMTKPSKDTRSAAEKARHTAGIVGNLKHEGYVPTPERRPCINASRGVKSHPRKPSKSFVTVL